MRAARRYEELVVWQLADELRKQVTGLTSRPQYAVRARRLREQTDDALDSVCRNVAEGFGADTHGQFAWFLRVSRRSLKEAQDALHSARQKGILTDRDLQPIHTLVRRTIPALNNLIRYLEKNPRQRNRPL
jgi:four helix bundle protein